MTSLDECGLEVAGCRHAFGLKALNMFRGEMWVLCNYIYIAHTYISKYTYWSSVWDTLCILHRYGYPHYLHVKVFPNVKYIWGDVICLYWPWALKKSSAEENAMKATPCLSVMHGKAHSWHCQVYILFFTAYRKGRTYHWSCFVLESAKVA